MDRSFSFLLCLYKEEEAMFSDSKNVYLLLFSIFVLISIE
ncbi:hypothetical protein H375_9170 [Rickettsia prowazekii str. Breinl]|nr:hypothetical protein H375_9170 [Rickettsia prowazekii str. Breinl]